MAALNHGPLKLTGCWGKTAERKQGTVVIELENVGYNYGGGELLSDVSVKLAPGSFHFLTGPSGAGKTTLLKLCYGALTPTSGRVRAFNMDVQGLDRDQMAHLRRRVGVVHQDCRFLDHLPVIENIALPLIVAGKDLAQEEANLRELLNWVGLSQRADALPPELSGGERQRAALARSVILSPDVIAGLRRAELLDATPGSRKALVQAQQAFTDWHRETGLPYSHLSRILSFSVG